MASLNPKALRRLAHFCAACGTFRTKEIGELDEVYGREIHPKSEAEFTEVGARDEALGDRVGDHMEAAPALGGGDSPRLDEAHKDESRLPAEKKSSTLSLRRLLGRAFSKKRAGKVDDMMGDVKVAGDEKEVVLEFGQMLLDLSLEDFLKVKSKNGVAKVQEEVVEKEKVVVLEFGQMLMDLSPEDFLKVKSKNGVAAPFIVVTPAPEDGLSPFVV